MHCGQVDLSCDGPARLELPVVVTLSSRASFIFGSLPVLEPLDDPICGQHEFIYHDEERWVSYVGALLPFLLLTLSRRVCASSFHT
jgi:hypothetical protein